MKTVRVNMATWKIMMAIKHEQELLKLDVVNMSDVQDVMAWRHDRMREALAELDEDKLEEIMNTKFIFTDKADVAAQPMNGDEEDEDEDVPTPRRRKKKTTSKAAAAKRRRRASTDDEDD